MIIIMKIVSVYVMVFGLYVTGQKREGDSCVDTYTNAAGRCSLADKCKTANDDYLWVPEGEACVEDYTNAAGRCIPVDQCQSAKENYQLNGIRPTFCVFDTFGDSLVCCRDGISVLQVAAKANPDPRSSGSDQKRISERKCAEYNSQEPETTSIYAAQCSSISAVQLIVGGEDASQGEFPHMAAIGWANARGYSYLCGGSLISPRFVLSAGHCLSTEDSTLQNPEPVVVRLGDQNIDPSVIDGADPFDVLIKKSYKHPDYEPPKTYNDIALFELNVAVSFNAAVRPACLWTHADFGNNNRAIAIGWGQMFRTRRGRAQKTTTELQKVSLSLLTNEYCDPLLADIQNRHWQGFRPSQMCAGELRGGKDTCQGDSGSPVQVTSKENPCIFHIIGVTSFGWQCAEVGKPGVYTRVSSFIDWIEQTVWPGE